MTDTTVALVTVPPSVPSQAGELARQLVPRLREHLELAVFVPNEGAGEALEGHPTRPLAALAPREHERILYLVTDEPAQAFLLPALRALGGVAALASWGLGALTVAAFPELERAGWRGRLRAWREGGLAAARGWSPATARSLVLNRSVVRFADAFLVPDPELRARILADRNAPTPVRVVPFAPADGGDGGDGRGWDALARLWAEGLRAFPHHRTNRKSLIHTAIEQADRVRAEREAEREAQRGR